ncbi:hypothetical protein NDU88_007312 [Pleurodeles waltl]|uniref:Uncharacterized protein n=1 Tax=Pleurodeles waltl TaxID=8319 RepID=A0AAV7MPX0_PLEWA|nr:hypothetical protein NDU88_007312 [Pleurodeles waltl]
MGGGGDRSRSSSNRAWSLVTGECGTRGVTTQCGWGSEPGEHTLRREVLLLARGMATALVVALDPDLES